MFLSFSVVCRHCTTVPSNRMLRFLCKRIDISPYWDGQTYVDVRGRDLMLSLALESISSIIYAASFIIYPPLQFTFIISRPAACSACFRLMCSYGNPKECSNASRGVSGWRGRVPARRATDNQVSPDVWAVPAEEWGACERQEPQKLSCKRMASIGVNLYTFKGAWTPVMLKWAPSVAIWAPTTGLTTWAPP